MPRFGRSRRIWPRCMRGEVYRLPARGRGHEQQGRRYAVVLQPDWLTLSTWIVASTSTSAQVTSFFGRWCPSPGRLSDRRGDATGRRGPRTGRGPVADLCPAPKGAVALNAMTSSSCRLVPSRRSRDGPAERSASRSIRLKLRLHSRCRPSRCRRRPPPRFPAAIAGVRPALPRRQVRRRWPGPSTSAGAVRRPRLWHRA